MFGLIPDQIYDSGRGVAKCTPDGGDLFLQKSTLWLLYGRERGNQ